MTECIICMKVFGLGVDKNGEKHYGGIKLSLGKFKPGFEKTYKEIISNINKIELLKFIGLDKQFKPEDCVFISPEEYAQNFED